MPEVVIVSAVRSPFGKFGGALRDVPLPELAAPVLREALRRADLQPDAVEEVALGVNLPGGDRSIARQAQLKAGLPDTVFSYTVDRACCSSLTAINQAVRGIRLGERRIALAGGVENMSQVPYFLKELRWGHRLGHIDLADQLIISCPHTGVPRAVQAGEEAVKYGIGRAEQDEWAVRSHQRYWAAQSAGHFADEVLPLTIELPGGRGAALAADESPRRDTTLAGLAALPTIYGSPTVTAGNAPGLSSGATAMLLLDGAEAARRGLRPLATVVGSAQVAGHPHGLASIPAVAAQTALRRAGLTVDAVDRIEINEAFAAMPLVSTLLLAGEDRARAERLRERTNVNGGAIAIGHPTGASAARLVMTLIYELQRHGGGIGLATICGGIGEGEALIVKVAA